MTYQAFLLIFLLPQLLLVMGLLMTRYRTSAPAVQEDLRRGMALVTALTMVHDDRAGADRGVPVHNRPDAADRLLDAVRHGPGPTRGAARARRLAALALTPLLWASDTVAIHNGSWRISAGRTTGVAVFGLPMEEAVFFLATNLLVVNSVALVAAPAMRERLGRWLRPGSSLHGPA